MSFFCALALLAPAPAKAQFTGYSSPQGVVQNQPPILNAVSAATTAAVSQGLGQNIHFIFFTVAGNILNLSVIDLRLEGSYDNSTWFSISDDATDKSAKGEVIAIGYYPFVRVNLAAFTTSGGNTVTAFYSGTSSTGSTPYGFYNPGQQIRKVVLIGQSAGTSSSTISLAAPFGSTAGFILLFSAGGVPAASTFQLGAVFGEITASFGSTAIPTGALTQLIPIAATPANSVNFLYVSGGASANKISAYYIFYPPGAAIPNPAQPPATSNTEATATNATVTTTLLLQSTFQRAHLFSVSARCSAGTAGLTVTDGATTIWSTGATEVGTTTFRYQWSPGLGSTTGNSLVISLTTCGAANVGTLDVQGSTF